MSSVIFMTAISCRNIEACCILNSLKRKKCDEDEWNEWYNKDIDEVLRDDYFDVDKEASRVYNVASIQGQKVNILDEPTLEQTLHREIMAYTPTTNPKPAQSDMDMWIIVKY